MALHIPHAKGQARWRRHLRHHRHPTLRHKAVLRRISALRWRKRASQRPTQPRKDATRKPPLNTMPPHTCPLSAVAARPSARAVRPVCCSLPAKPAKGKPTAKHEAAAHWGPQRLVLLGQGPGRAALSPCSLTVPPRSVRRRLRRPVLVWRGQFSTLFYLACWLYSIGIQALMFYIVTVSGVPLLLLWYLLLSALLVSLGPAAAPQRSQRHYLLCRSSRVSLPSSGARPA